MDNLVESCAGRVNPRGLRVPAFSGQVWAPHCFACGAGAGCTYCGCGLRNYLCG